MVVESHDIRKALHDIREFFWPLLEGKADTLKKIKTKDCMYADDEFEFLFNVAKDYQSSENERRDKVESKASVFIGTFAVATTIMLSLAKDFSSNSNSLSSIMNIILVVATIIYLCRAIIFSIRCVSRKNYSDIGFPKYLLTNQSHMEKKQRLLLELLNDIKANQIVINKKVDNMNMAQKYFIRAVVCVCVLTVILLIETIACNV